MYARSFNSLISQSFFLFGPRGVGKTAWLKSQYKDSLYFDLLDSETYTTLIASPRRLGDFIHKDYQQWVLIDEVQRIPELLNEVHRLIESRKLKFILTGSSARKLRREGVNLLAGRALTKFMHPLTVKELGTDFNLKACLRYGCLPAVFSQQDPKSFLKSYVTTYLREEVQQEGIVRNLPAFYRFLEAASFSQAAPLNVANVSRECGLKEKVAHDYFSILEDLLLAVRLPVFSRHAKRKLSTHPKFLFFDAGVFSAIRPRGPLDTPEQIEGASLETLFFQQIQAYNDYNDWNYSFHFWRSASKQEVDFVLYGERGLHAFEIKLSDRIRSEDLESLRLFAADYPAAKLYCLYLGQREWTEHNISILNFENVITNAESIL